MTSIFRDVVNLEKAGVPGALCTIISTAGSTPRREGSKILVYHNGEFTGTIGGGELEHRVIGEAIDAMNDGTPRTISYSMTDPDRGDPGVCGGQLKIFIEPILPKKKLIIIGGGHVGREVAHLGHWLGFKVIVCDDRPEISNPETIPDADDFYYDSLSSLKNDIEIDQWTYFVLTTRSVDVDISILPIILMSDAAYFGVIGSKRRWATTKNKLQASGIPEEKIIAIHSPIGLDIGAETPEEIALSIMAEITSLINTG
jgi:xanthine dehydrogenase accessory factor